MDFVKLIRRLYIIFEEAIRIMHKWLPEILQSYSPKKEKNLQNRITILSLGYVQRPKFPAQAQVLFRTQVGLRGPGRGFCIPNSKVYS